MVFTPELFPPSFRTVDMRSRSMLTLGSVVNKLHREGQVDKAAHIVGKVHSILGMHGEQFTFCMCTYFSGIHILAELLLNQIR